MTDQKWAIALAEPGRDFTAEQSLRRGGWRVIFLYRRKLFTGHRGDWRNTHAFTSAPLLVGYGFVQLWPGQEWPKLGREAGFTGLLGGSAPVWLDDATVHDWQRRTQEGEFDDRLPAQVKSDPSAKFKPATGEDERAKLLQEFLAKIDSRYAIAS